MIKETKNTAQEALRNSHICDLRDLRVEQVEETLMISGTVKTFYHKQLAQEAVRSVSPDAQVVNAVAVDTYECTETIW